MHILFLSDNFPPEVNAPASRTHEHCREWVAAGHQVTVITCAPNFPKGRVFDGYRNALWQCEVIDGIRVVRVWSYITTNVGFLGRFLDYVSFMLAATVASLCIRKVDVVVGTSPQFFTACAAWMVGGLKRRPWVFELRDLWPESIKAVGAMKNPTVIGLLEKLELFLYRRATRIVTVTHSFKRTLGARGIDTDKIDVITNGVDISRFSPRPKDKALMRDLAFEGKFVAGYIGTHGMAHALETVLQAAQRLKAMPGGESFQFLFLGDGARKLDLQAQAAQMRLDNVVFVESVPKDEVARYWSVLDVSIIHLRRTELFTTVIPSKIFECMGMGLPLLHGVAGESAEIVQREGVGLVFEPENVHQLVHHLLAMHGDAEARDGYRRSGPQAARRYDRRTLALEMLGILERVRLA